MRANPYYVEFCTTLESCMDQWAQSWKGDSWRFQEIDFPTGKDILSGEGARLYGGRLNFRGSFHVVYGSADEMTALYESRVRAKRYGLKIRKPRILVAIELQLQRVLDLRIPSITRRLGVRMEELACENWENLQFRGIEALSQALGRAAFHTGFEAVVIPSFAYPGGTNLAWFPHNMKEGSSAVIHEGSKLPKVAEGKTIIC